MTLDQRLLVLELVHATNAAIERGESEVVHRRPGAIDGCVLP
jgi:hypothetical protein